MKHLYLFDLDDTLTTSASGDKFPRTPEDRTWLPGRMECLHYLRLQGKQTAIITNQGGAAWKIFQPERMNGFLDELCARGKINKYFVCYHETSLKAQLSIRTAKPLTVPDLYRGHDRRKPGPGMLFEAMDAFHVTKQEEVLMVGDRPEDEQAAINAGIDFCWSHVFFS